MARITCEYCNTEYESEMDQCPLCGMPAPDYAPVREEPETPRPAEKRKQTRSAKRGVRAAPNEDKIPRWICVLICAFLSLAVVAVSIYALFALEIIKPGKDKEDASLDLPITDTDTDTNDSPEPEQDAEPQPEPEPVACTGLRLTEERVVLTEMGSSSSLVPEIEPENCTETINWVSSNPSVCTVDADGVATALGEGSAVITAVCGEQAATATVICDFGSGVSATGGMSLSSDDVTLLAEGATVKLTVEGASIGAEVAWSSDDEAVCTVEDGLVTAAGPGEATVTATVSGQELECTVRCRFEGGSTASSGKQLDHSDVTLKVGESFEISVVDGISGGWNVSNGSVITVDGNGIVTALAKGTASVYTVVDGKRLSCTVRVN